MSEDLKCKECGKPILTGELCWDCIAEELVEKEDQEIEEPPF